VSNRDSRESAPLFFSNSREGLELLKCQVRKWQKVYDCNVVVIGMEPTAGYWMPMFTCLEEEGFDVRLVSSLKVRRSKEIRDNSPLKSDSKDALLIADLVRRGIFLDYRRQPDDVNEVRVLVKHAEDLEKAANVCKNHLEHLTSVHFPEIEEVFKEIGSTTMRSFLRECPFPKDTLEAGREKVEKLLWDASRGQMRMSKAKRLYELAQKTIGVGRVGSGRRLELYNVLDVLDLTESRLAVVKEHLSAVLETMPQYEILCSIKGIGLMTAASIIAALGDLSRYGSARQVLKMVGLNLYRLSSGNRRGVDKISRRGMSLVRKHLFMAALSASRAGGVFEEKYRSMTSRGMKAKKALVAVMRKLLKLAYALVRDNRKFEKNYSPQRRAERDVIVIKQAEAA
jgi:transposase